ncbi:MAG: CDP-diacylglycerol--glycerol-3-phosphate 3-phosphatidyltransferase [Candidatus Nanopelagicales bacterium]
MHAVDHAADAVSPRASAVNLPNALTLGRLLLVPVFGYLLLMEGGEHSASRIAATAVFLLASVTDWVDGYLARRSNQVTTFGKVVDPLADKALTGTALMGLSLLGLLPWWMTLVILAREIGVTIVRFLVIHHGVIPASRGGKSKTVAQMVAISLFLLPGLTSGFGYFLQWACMWVALLLTVLTGLDYLVKARSVRRAGHARRAATRQEGS